MKKNHFHFGLGVLVFFSIVFPTGIPFFIFVGVILFTLTDEGKNLFDVKKWEEDIKKWKKEKEDYFKKQHIRNQPLLEKKEAYFKKNNNVLIEYCKMVLSNSEYPESFPRKYNIDYNPTNKILVVDFALPSPDDVPNLKEVKYIISKDEIKEVFLSATAFNKMYDNLLYQITLRTIHELFVADAILDNATVNTNATIKTTTKARFIFFPLITH